MAVTHGDLAQGMACGGHIPVGNHKITRTNGATPVTNSYPVQACRMAKLDLTVEMRLGQRQRQRSMMTPRVNKEVISRHATLSMVI
jgi:hypothetical protein